MFAVVLMRRDGVRLAKDEIERQSRHYGEFTMDSMQGARRLRLKNTWTGVISAVELFDPILVATHGSTQRWRGYERSGDAAHLQEWLVRIAE